MSVADFSHISYEQKDLTPEEYAAWHKFLREEGKTARGFPWMITAGFMGFWAFFVFKANQWNIYAVINDQFAGLIGLMLAAFCGFMFYMERQTRAVREQAVNARQKIIICGDIVKLNYNWGRLRDHDGIIMQTEGQRFDINPNTLFDKTGLNDLKEGDRVELIATSHSHRFMAIHKI